ncbi:Caveolin-2 [Pleodorina starrii]|uniref:Caveolin-2 n=1 Tax=Pleodorina starrii TaxID=330485 RepID=A0A9W6C0X7_9CHLO|nr:Caveolin-2 [Pleodorina starrii]GLC69982.1 Caveolin-2 [Pleodorina starrii]
MAESLGVLVAKDDGREHRTTSRYELLAAAYPDKSCLVFSKNSSLRKYCILIISSGIFDKFIFFVILCNCVTLALSSGRQDFDSTRLGKALAILDYVYIGVFTWEMILKVISMGFVLRKGTYLRDGWNVLDCLVVVMGYASLLSPSNLTAIRAFRAMRPLRAINRVKAMKVLVNTMIGSLPLLLDVFLLCAFTFFIFSLVAVQLFAGALRYRCGSPDFSGSYVVADGAGGGDGPDALQQQQQLLANVSYVVAEEQAEGMCSGPLSSEVAWYLVNGTPTAVPGSGYAGRVCDDGMYCTLYGNPVGGLLSYDTILWSWLTVFQHITLSGWSDVMYMVMDAVNYWVWTFYVALIIFGAFFMVNLALAVLALKFSADSRVENKAKEEQRAAAKEAAGWAQGAEGVEAQEAAAAGLGCIRSPTLLMEALKARRQKLAEDEDEPATGSPPPDGLGTLRQLAWRVAVSRSLELTTAALILVNTAVMCVNWYGMPYKVEDVTNFINYGLTGYFALEVAVRITAFGARFFVSGMNLFDFLVVVVSVVEVVMDLIPSVAGLGPLSVLRAFRLLRVFRLARSWRELNAIISGMFKSVQASISLVVLTVLFLFVAALIGMQVFGYKFMFCDYVEGASAVCPPGQEVWGECPNYFYCYLPCAADQYGSWIDAPGSFYNDLAYCDRFCASADAAAAATTNASSAAVAVTAAAGCEYLAMVGKSQVPRAQFDNMLWGLYTVFQVLTGENWNDVMYDAMRTVSPWASLYFVGVILIGNYLVFNLFIAILLDNLDLKVQEANTAAASAAGADSGAGGDNSNRKGSRRPLSAAALAPLQLDGSGDTGGVAGTGSGCDGSGGGVGDDSAAAADGGGGEGTSARLVLKAPAFHGAGWGPESAEPQLGTAAAAGNDAAATHPGGKPGRLRPEAWSGGRQQGGVVCGVNGSGVVVPERELDGSPVREGFDGTAELHLPLPPAPALSSAAAADAAAFGCRPSVALLFAAEPAALGSAPAKPAAAAVRGRSPSAAVLLLPPEEPVSRSGAGPVAESVEAQAASGASGERTAVDQQHCNGARTVAVPQPPPPPEPSPPTCTVPRDPSPSSPSLAPCSLPAAEPVGVHAPALQAGPIAAAAAAAAAASKASPRTGSSSCSDSAVLLPVRPPCVVTAGADRGKVSFSEQQQLQLASALSSLSQCEQQQQQQQQHHHHHRRQQQHHEIPRTPLRGPSPSFLSRNAFREVLKRVPSLRASRRVAATAAAARIAPDGPPWQDVLRGRSLLLLGPENRIRCFAAAVVHNWWFESAILVFILASCVCLVLDSPSLDPTSRLSTALQSMDYVFTAVFTVEAGLKIVTFGFAFTGPHAYIRSGWNVLDLAIVLLGWALLIVKQVGMAATENVKVLRVLRALRALRPLRAVHGFPGLKVVVNTLFAVLPSMVHVALVCVFFYLIFAILAVNLFKGKLYNCIDAASGERIDPFYVLPAGEKLTRSWCEAGSHTISQSAYYSALNVSMPEYSIQTQWVNPTANFDNVGTAMLTLFQVATLSLWVDITFSAVDATGVDQQPLENHSPWVVLLFILFIVVCTFFVLNLFVGVTLDKFAEMQQLAQDVPSAFLTPQQQSWVDTQRLLLRAEAGVRPPPPRPRGQLRGALYTLASSRAFEVLMLGVILANVAFMAMVHWDMGAGWQAVMSNSNLVFTCIFVAEAALKLTAFGPRHYFRDGWNCFDFFVVVVSVASVVLDFSNTHAISFMPVLRVLRVVRVIRLIRHARGMQKLVRTLITSLPALTNVGGVMLIFFFVFAVIGVNLFAGIKQGEALDGHANFDNFPNAMLLLFRMLTGEGWDAVMQDCMRMDGCVLVLQDINVTLPDSASAATTTTASTTPEALAAAAAVITLTGGTYLDPSDPLLASLPANATDNQCPLSAVAAIVYFPLFVVLCTFILLQLVIAVLLENLVEEDDSEEEEAARPVPQSVIESFTGAWAAAAAEAAAAGELGSGRGRGRRRRGLLPVGRLPGVLVESEPPLGARGSANPRQEVHQRLLRMRVPLYEGNQVSFIEVLHALTGSLCGTDLPAPVLENMQRKLSKRLPQDEPHVMYTAAHYHAATTVAAAVRGFVLRHQFGEKVAAFDAKEEQRRLRRQNKRRPQQQPQPQQQQPQPQPAAAGSSSAPTQQPHHATSSSVGWLVWLLGLSRPAPPPPPSTPALAVAAPPRPHPQRSLLSQSLRYLVRLPLAYATSSVVAVIRGFLCHRPAAAVQPAGFVAGDQQQQQQQQLTQPPA